VQHRLIILGFRILHIPTSLFRYRTLNSENCAQELDAISENYVWLSKFENLNDPMEFSIQNNFGKGDTFAALKTLGDLAGISSAEVENSIQEMLGTARNYSICCFSNSPHNEPMWAYYAGSFSGICLEYDTNLLHDRSVGEEHPLIPIAYSSMSPKFSFDSFVAAKSDIGLELHRAFIATKKNTWQHENETRLIQNRAGKFYHAPNALKSITLGPRASDETIAKLMEIVQNRSLKINMLLTDGYSSSIKMTTEFVSAVVDRSNEIPDLEKFSAKESLPIGGVRSAFQQAFSDPDFDGHVDSSRKADQKDILWISYRTKILTNNPIYPQCHKMYFKLTENEATRCFRHVIL
jgi:Protein of unknown function (DUF2971)